MRQALTELRASASSPDGGVTVVTGPGGAILAELAGQLPAAPWAQGVSGAG